MTQVSVFAVSMRRIVQQDGDSSYCLTANSTASMNWCEKQSNIGVN